MKVCKICGEAKPLTEFHKDRQKTDGHAPYCKPCFIAKQRQYQARPPRRPAPEGFKRCSRCKSVKPVAEFHKSANRFGGLEQRCKTCSAELRLEWARKNPEKAAALQRRWREQNPERSRDHGRKYRYGIELGTYAKMLAEQDGRCAICGTSESGVRGRESFHVDHDHETGAVRGLLCSACNTGIGGLRHDKTILERAIQYLDRYP